MRADSYKIWWIVKGKIVSRFGDIVGCAAKLRCSTTSLRKAVDGQCPGIAARLKAEIGFDWDNTAAVRAALAELTPQAATA